MQIKKLTLALATISAIGLSGCTTVANVAGHKDLTVNSKMSDSLFLDPVKQSEKVVFISVKNTTSQKLGSLDKDIASDLQANGWTITDNVDKAFYMIQVNVMQAGEAKDQEDALGTIESGFGSAVGGGMAGVATGMMTGNYKLGGAVGMGTAAGDYIGSQLTKDKTFSVITDVQIGKKVSGKVTQVTQSSLANGSSGATTQTYSEDGNWQKHRVRIGTVADQMNLTLAKAMPEIEKQLSQEISGILK